MAQFSSEQILASIKRFENLDPELFLELHSKLPTLSTGEGIQPRVAFRGLAEAEVRSVDGSIEGMVPETIVRPFARPVMVIRDNRVTTEFLGPESQVWADRIQTAQSILDRVIPAIGRIELSNNPDFSWVGTGWLVAKDIIVTNRHVAQEFGRQSGQGFTFKAGVNGLPMASQIDFLEEDQRRTALEYAVDAILWIAPSGESDVAFMRVSRKLTDLPLASPILLAENLNDVEFIATIGYPARDSRVPDQALVRRLFGDVYDKKRLAPGQIISAGLDEIQHDCSTLGGNSGSPLINLKTGEAVGLHFSGLFMEANFAVPAPKVSDLLRRVQRGELPGKAAAGTAISQTSQPLPSSTTPGSYTFQIQVPIEITVKVNTPAVIDASVQAINGTMSAENIFESAMATVRQMAANDPNIIEVRRGYRFKRGWITNERVVVVEVKEKQSYNKLRESGIQAIPSQVLGIGTDVRTASVPDQLEHLGIDIFALEARARAGFYREPANLSLPVVRDKMKAVFHVSPDSGFPNLKAFLSRVERKLTATIYEWEAEHISDAVANAVRKEGVTLKMVTQRPGTKAAVEDMKARVGAKFEHVFASVGSGKLFPSAYHIKVASRDDEEIWLSSGNWKKSNQDDISPARQNSTSMRALREHNREWHAIIENTELAVIFKNYIDFDFDEARRVPIDEGVEVIFPDIFVPEAAFVVEAERLVRAKYFDPLTVNKVLEIQPLLTPDRTERGVRQYMSFALAMIQKATRKIYLENQSFNLLEENVAEFEEFFSALKAKQQSGIDVRIIFRDSREFGAANGPKLQKLLERLKDFGFDTDFIRVQKGCHTKGIIVDSAEVLLGSHNLTNEGSLFNRDASLIVRDAQVAAYFEQIFLFDWEVLATQESDELVAGIMVAHPGQETPPGFRRVSIAEMLGES